MYHGREGSVRIFFSMPLRSFDRQGASVPEDRYSLAAQQAELDIKRERFRRERQEAGEDVPTPILARAFLGLRKAIVSSEVSEDAGDVQAVPPLTELLRQHPAIRQEFSSLVRDLSQAQQPDASGKIIPLDVTDSAWRGRSEAWIDTLLAVFPEATPSRRAEIRRSAERYFQAYASVLYARTLQRFVQGQVRAHEADLQNPQARREAQRHLERAVAERFALSQIEARHFVEMHLPEARTDRFLEKIAFLREIWERNARNLPQRALVEAAALTVVGNIVEAQMPKRLEGIYDGDRFSFQAYVACMVAEVAGELLREAEVDASQRINQGWRSAMLRRHLGSSLFRRREQGDLQDDMERRRLVEEGTDAIDGLREMVLERMGPPIIGLCTTLAALARLHPAAALAGAGAIPLFGYLQRQHLEAGREQKARVRAGREAINRRLSVLSYHPDDIRQAQDAGAVAEEMLDLERRLQGSVTLFERMKRRVKGAATGYAVKMSAGIAAHFAQEAEILPPGSARQFMSHLKGINMHVDDLLSTTTEDLDGAIEKIRTMERALGPEAEYDLPDGPRERPRLPVSRLPSYDIALEGLWYGVLKGASETIREGELVHLIGASGSGKSTILKQISGTLVPGYGEVRIGGVPHQAIRRYGEDSLTSIMAYVEQTPKLNTRASMRENLLALAPSTTVGDDEIRSVLRTLGLGEFSQHLDAPIGHPLSGGELVRFGLAKALLRHPKILLLDEPTGPLDQKMAPGIWCLIDELHASHPRMTIVVVTHDPIRLQLLEQTPNARQRIIHMEDLHARSESPPSKKSS